MNFQRCVRTARFGSWAARQVVELTNLYLLNVRTPPGCDARDSRLFRDWLKVNFLSV